MFCVVLFCTRDIYCRAPSAAALPEVPSFLSSFCHLLKNTVEGRRVSFTVQIVKPPDAMWLVAGLGILPMMLCRCMKIYVLLVLGADRSSVNGCTAVLTPSGWLGWSPCLAVEHFLFKHIVQRHRPQIPQSTSNKGLSVCYDPAQKGKRQ